MKLKNILAATACMTIIGTATLAQDGPSVDTVLATVNGIEITVGHVIALTDRLPEQYQKIEDAELYKGVLDQLINQTAISSTTDAEAKDIKLAIENETRALLAGRALDQIGAAAATEEAVLAGYEAKYGNLPTELEYRASHILVGSEDEAKALVVTLAGGADFAELAKEKSTGPSGPGGGDLGWFTPERMVPEFSGAVKELAAGGVSAPIKTQFGWHVIKLFETRDIPPPTLEEVRTEIEGELTDAAIKAAIEKFEADALIVRSDVVIDPSMIRKMELLK